jgi:hypothetical protein
MTCIISSGLMVGVIFFIYLMFNCDILMFISCIFIVFRLFIRNKVRIVPLVGKFHFIIKLPNQQTFVF